MLFQAKIKNNKLILNDLKKFNDFITRNNCDVEVRIEKVKSKRTSSQNSALHKYFSLLSKQMSDAGYTVQYILNFTADLQPTPSFAKRLWQEFQLKKLGKRHTRDLLKNADIDKVYDELNLFLVEKLKLENIPFPEKEKDEKVNKYLDNAKE